MTETARLILVHVTIFACVGVAMLLVRLAVRAVGLFVGIIRLRPCVRRRTGESPTSSAVGERSAVYASARPFPDGFPIALFMGLPPEEIWNSQEAHPTSV